MGKIMKEKDNRVKWIVNTVLLLISAAVLYVTHRAIPFMMDDLWYATNLSSGTPLSSLSDIIESQIWHYHNWGGRSMTHTLLQLILILGENVADILNVLTTLVLAGVICLVAEHRSLPAWVAGIGMLLGLNANWKLSMFWQSGAANYLYITVLILLFLYCYLREVREPEKQLCLRNSGQESAEATEADVQGAGVGAGCARKELPGIVFWIIPLGIVAGWSNENMGPAVWVVSLLVMLLLIKEKQKVKLWMILGNISCFVGSVLVVAAPGNFVRSAEAVDHSRGTLWSIFLRCYGEAQAALNFLFPTLLVLAGVLMLSKGVLKLPIGRKNILLLFCALLSWGAMILSPHYPDRATFGTMVLLICVILSLVRGILRERKDLSLWLWGASLLIWLRGMYYMGEYLAICWGWIV